AHDLLFRKLSKRAIEVHELELPNGIPCDLCRHVISGNNSPNQSILEKPIIVESDKGYRITTERPHSACPVCHLREHERHPILFRLPLGLNRVPFLIKKQGEHQFLSSGTQILTVFEQRINRG